MIVQNALAQDHTPRYDLPDDFVSRSDGLRIRSVDEGKRTASFIASTDSIDSHDERVTQDWDLERYKKNPIVLYGHDRWSKLPIGQAIECGVENDQLVCTILFATAEANPLAEQVWQLVRQKVLRAVSVGFRAHSYRFEMEEDREILVLSKCELYEISVVPIPANPDALAKMKQRALAAKDQPAKARAEEIDMDLQKMLDKATADLAERDATIARLKGEAADKDKSLTETKEKLATAETDLATRTTERDNANKARDEANDKLIDLEVGALIGKKITAAQKDAFVKMRKSDKALFDDVISKQPDMKLDEQIIKNTETQSREGGGDDLGDIIDGIGKSARA